MKGETIAGVCFFGAALLWATFVITSASWTSWRPQVSKWGGRTSPHQARVMHVPERIIWEGVEYDCVLREKEVK